ncbi:hypothetical protein [Pectobacterium brasiliense]|uniref:hypothetical protein n=1 Tax=Pectobacterium brasiliense TaxID=180957 RepID=UPI000C1C701C|nr:hypothetical protein [Pectobacterium brasiliense]ATV41991.1 hypothetical protein CTV95_00290 [Pectobacterium brasiliense]MCA6983569.1 hypothetical protein [Pectobacterium brasiliense]MCH4993121.1 hypothetical protein [Pectobacterium brasiliense]
MFQFKEFIKAGQESASHVEKNHKDIGDVFRSLNKELESEAGGHLTLSRLFYKDLLDFDFTLKELEEYDSGRELNIPAKGRLGIIYDGDMSDIATWEQHADGYPFTIEYQGERVDCWDQESLANALGKMVSSAQFWLKVKELSSRAQAKGNSPF